MVRHSLFVRGAYRLFGGPTACPPTSRIDWRTPTAVWMSSEVTFDLEAKASRLATLEASMAAPGFWDVPERARQAVEELRQWNGWTEPYDALRRRANDAVEL